MKTIILIVSILLVLSSQSYAFIREDWTKTNTALEVTWLALHTIDWGQSLDISRNSNKFYEINPLLGNHPSVGNINTWGIISTVGHISISYILPYKYRNYWQWVTIGSKGIIVGHNFSIGLKVKF